MGNVGRKNNLLTTFDADLDSNFFWKRKNTKAPVAKQPNKILSGSDVGSLKTSTDVDSKPLAAGTVFFSLITVSFVAS